MGCEDVDLIQLAQEGFNGHLFAITVMKFRVP
jgi:hypothetical protein